MNTAWIAPIGALVLGVAALSACSSSQNSPQGDDGGYDAASTPDSPGAETEPGDAPASQDGTAGGHDGGASDAPADSTHTDAADGGGTADGGGEGGEAGAPPRRLLLSYNGSTTSELVAFGLDSRAVDGRFTYPGFIGTTYGSASNPWLLEQASDVVGRLDPYRPWVVQSSWNVGLNDVGDGGFASSYSDPDAVIVGAGSKAYVLRYTRNLIAVIDPSQNVDGGAPLKTIDLSGQLQAAGDGYVEMTAGWYDASHGRVWVLLANINRNLVACGGYCQLCSNTSPTLVAIDVATDSVVTIGADAGGGGGDSGVVSSGYVLPGYDPAFGSSSMVYDAANNRLLVLETGCNLPADGGAGALVRRQVDAVSLSDGSVQTVLDLTSASYPGALFLVDAHHAIVQLDTAYAWDPTTSVLGATIPNAPDTFAVDTQGNLVGVSTQYGSDGGVSGVNVVSVSSGDGGVTVLGQNPFSLTGGFVGGAELWPAH
jgi:hypothetical protein